MSRTCTIWCALALIAYRDEQVASRYDAPEGELVSGKIARSHDVLYLMSESLPGNLLYKDFVALPLGPDRIKAQRDCEIDDNKRWIAAVGRLIDGLQTARVTAFLNGQRLSSDYWMTNTFSRGPAEFARVQRDQVLAMCAMTLPAREHGNRGRPKDVCDRIASRMRQDFKDNEDALRREKQQSLADRYLVARGTVKKARDAVLGPKK